jgi:hypothetical protein
MTYDLYWAAALQRAVVVLVRPTGFEPVAPRLGI